MGKDMIPPGTICNPEPARLRDECARLRDELSRTRSALAGRLDEVDGLISQRDGSRAIADALQSLLDERTAEVAELNEKLDALRSTCNRLQDRDAYRDWCYRLKVSLRKVENERDAFHAYAASCLFVFSTPTSDRNVRWTVQSAVNHAARLALMGLGELMRAGYRKPHVQQLEKFRRHVTRCYASGQFDPNTKGE